MALTTVLRTNVLHCDDERRKTCMPSGLSMSLSLTNHAAYLCKCNGLAPPNMCYYAEFGRSSLKVVGINTELPKLESSGTVLS